MSYKTGALYIHWPFCPYRCHFCPFIAMAGHEKYIEPYFKALSKEIEQFCDEYKYDNLLESIYVGGGTPSLCPNRLILDIFGTILNRFKFSDNYEVTIEVNPGTVVESQFPIWREIGVNRLSIGVQSLNDSVLKNLNRLQSTKDVYNLLNIASKFFNNISIDLILGLPNITEDDWKCYLKEIVDWPIKHISIYFLTIHENTPIFFKVKNGRIKLMEDDRMVALYEWTVEFLEASGFSQYELSNFSKKGFESRHNLVYWQRKAYKGFGLGACSFDGKFLRLVNEKNLLNYLKKSDEGASLTVFSEVLSKEQVALEKIMLGLRQCKRGLLIDGILRDFSKKEKESFFKNIAFLEKNGLLKVRDGRLYLTLKGLSVENEIVLKLMTS